jgi:hypothetical protein
MQNHDDIKPHALFHPPHHPSLVDTKISKKVALFPFLLSYPIFFVKSSPLFDHSICTLEERKLGVYQRFLSRRSNEVE